MHDVRMTGYGMKFIFSGNIDREELKVWSRKASEFIKRLDKGFGIMVDMRGMAPLSTEGWEFMTKNMRSGGEAGMGRCAMVFDDPITSMQFWRLSRHAGISDRTRQLDGNSLQDWEKVAMDWILRSINPPR